MGKNDLSFIALPNIIAILKENAPGFHHKFQWENNIATFVVHWSDQISHMIFFFICVILAMLSAAALQYREFIEDTSLERNNI